jgi:hypothetical protein
MIVMFANDVFANAFCPLLDSERLRPFPFIQLILVSLVLAVSSIYLFSLCIKRCPAIANTFNP